MAADLSPPSSSVSSPGCAVSPLTGICPWHMFGSISAFGRAWSVLVSCSEDASLAGPDEAQGTWSYSLKGRENLESESLSALFVQVITSFLSCSDGSS